MTDFDTFDTDTVDDPDIDNEETGFIDPTGADISGGVDTAVSVATVGSRRQELLRSAIDDYYEALARNGQTPELGRDRAKFELLANGSLRLKAYPDIAATVLLASVEVKPIVNAKRAVLGTITLWVPRLGNRTKSCWFWSIVLGLFVTTSDCRTPFTPRGSRSLRYGFSLCP